MHSDDNCEKPLDSKQKAILDAAFEAFRLYGFRRTSMEDIAKGSGMSRAALYLHYRNKEDIFGSLVQYYYDQASAQVQVILNAGRSPEDTLIAGFEAQTGPVFLAMIDSPHGRELMDTKSVASAEIAKVGEARLVKLYADWLEREEAAGRIDLTSLGRPTEVSQLIQHAFYGVKNVVTDSQQLRQSTKSLGRMLGIALAA